MATTISCDVRTGFDDLLRELSQDVDEYGGPRLGNLVTSLRERALSCGLVCDASLGEVEERPVYRGVHIEPELRQLLVVVSEAWRCLLVGLADGRVTTLSVVGLRPDVDLACRVITAVSKRVDASWAAYRHREFRDLCSLGDMTEEEVRADMARFLREDRRDFMTSLVDDADMAFAGQALRNPVVGSAFRAPNAVVDYVESLTNDGLR